MALTIVINLLVLQYLSLLREMLDWIHYMRHLARTPVRVWTLMKRKLGNICLKFFRGSENILCNTDLWGLRYLPFESSAIVCHSCKSRNKKLLLLPITHYMPSNCIFVKDKQMQGWLFFWCKEKLKSFITPDYCTQQ